jgi:predicted thioesterase
MKHIFKPDDIKTHNFRVEENDIVQFEQQFVHNVCATFTLAREIEWCTRLFVLDMLEKHEEGIGTKLIIEHQSPAVLGNEVLISGKLESVDKNEIMCSFVASVGDRIIASGETCQKILPKEKLQSIFSNLK